MAHTAHALKLRSRGHSQGDGISSHGQCIDSLQRWTRWSVAGCKQKETEQWPSIWNTLARCETRPLQREVVSNITCPDHKVGHWAGIDVCRGYMERRAGDWMVDNDVDSDAEFVL